MRRPLDTQDIQRLLAMVGLEADEAAIEALLRRVGYLQGAMESLDRADLGMTDPATVYSPDEEGGW